MYKKDGSTINSIVDTENLKKILEKGTWFARWNKDFNNFLVQTLCEVEISGKKHIKKISLQSFLLNVHTKAPIRHINGDTLDNRICNLEIYHQNKVNDYIELDQETIAIILRNKYGKENGKTLIDKEDLDRVINTGYCWVSYKKNGYIYSIANTPNGRIYLNEFIMKTSKNSNIRAINLNYLDNRKKNLSKKILSDSKLSNDNNKK